MIIISLLNNPILIVSNAHNRTRETESIYTHDELVDKARRRTRRSDFHYVILEKACEFDFQEESAIRSLRRCAESIKTGGNRGKEKNKNNYNGNIYLNPNYYYLYFFFIKTPNLKRLRC